MILLAIVIIWIMLTKWQIRHLHTVYENDYISKYKVGQRVLHHGVWATIIDLKTVDMVIRRDLSGLVLPRIANGIT